MFLQASNLHLHLNRKIKKIYVGYFMSKPKVTKQSRALELVNKIRTILSLSAQRISISIGPIG